MPNERNNWDRANNQGENHDDQHAEDTQRYLRKDDGEEDVNPNKDADGYGSESARSDHSGFKSGFGSRTGNNDANPSRYGTRGRDYYRDPGQGSSGRSS